LKRFILVLLRTLSTFMIIAGLLIGGKALLDKKINNNQTVEYNLPEPITVPSVSYDRYAYQHISEVAQKTYDQIYNCIINYNKSVVLTTTDEDVLATAYEAMMADYGNLFWVNGYQYNSYTTGEKVESLEFLPRYTMTEQQKKAYQSSVDEAVSQWLSGISTDASDFDKALYVFETLIEKVDYKEDSKENQNILSVFLYNETVCQGYADAAWYLLDQLGIRSTIISGTANNENHAWNLVYLDGAYYFMDVTWGNSKYLNQNQDTTKRVNYAYMAMTSEEISQNHVINSSFEIPECMSNADNYYVHQGLYYDWFGTDSIGTRLAESYRAGDNEYSLKFSSSDLYNRVIEYFFEEKHISEYVPEISSIYYLLDEDANVLTIQWKE